MGLENFNRWQWAVIGLLLGAMFGASQVFWRDGDPGGDRTFDREQFEGNLRHGMVIRNMKLHPPVGGQQWMSGEAYKLKAGEFRSPTPRRFGRAATQPAKWADGEWVSFPLLVSEQNSQRPRYDSHPEAIDYLESLHTRFPNADLAFKYSWWEEPKTNIALYAAGGLVLIGGVWPSVVSVLTGGPVFGKRKQPGDYDLDRFGKEPEPAVAVASGPPDDPDALIEYNLRLQEQVGDLAMTPTASQADPDDSGVYPAVTAPRPLGKDDAKDVPASGKPEKSEDPRDYGGVFYPVARPSGKPKDEK